MFLHILYMYSYRRKLYVKSPKADKKVTSSHGKFILLAPLYEALGFEWTEFQ